jgi:hypothetical protein
MSLIYIGEYRIRLRRIVWFHDGIYRIYDPRGNFVRHGSFRRWEVSFDRGPVMGDASSRSFTLALIVALCRTYWRAFARGARDYRAACRRAWADRP